MSRRAKTGVLVPNRPNTHMVSHCDTCADPCAGVLYNLQTIFNNPRKDLGFRVQSGDRISVPLDGGRKVAEGPCRILPMVRQPTRPPTSSSHLLVGWRPLVAARFALEAQERT